MRAALRTALATAGCTLVVLASLALMLVMLDGGVPDWEAKARMQRLPR